MKYRNLLYIGYFTFFSLTSCEQKLMSDQKAGIPSIPIEHEPQTEIFLEDISSNHTSIPLEMTEESLISHITDVAISESFLYVNDRNGIFQFDLKGKYKKKIGKIGEAPGNYQGVWSLAFDPSDKTIVVADYIQRIDVNERYYFVTYIIAGDYYLFGYDREKEKSWVVRDGLRMKNQEGNFLPKSKGKLSYLITQGNPGISGVEPNPTVHLINW